MSESREQQLKHKNIVFILCDQLRADFLSCYGAEFIETPNIDALCQHGVRYSRAVSPSPLCVPARASMLTGLNALSNGVLANNQWLRPDLETCGIKTWPERLAEHGYHTEAIGKMHFTPWDSSHGFTHRVISEDKRAIRIEDDYQAYLNAYGLRKYHGNEHEGYFENKGAVISTIPLEHQIDRWVGEQTRQFLKQTSKDKPFALMVGFPGPHCPYDPTAELARLFRPEDMPDSIAETQDSRMLHELFIKTNIRSWNQVNYSDFREEQKKLLRAYYAGLVYQIDQEIGAIVQTLKDMELYEDTVIMFASDHGDFLGDFGFVGKHFFYEPSIHIPLIIHHASIEGSVVNHHAVSLTDIHETILQIAQYPALRSNQSVMLPGLPFGDSRCTAREAVFGATDVGLMIMDADWKLCRYYNGLITLHSVHNDPEEQNNLAYRTETLEEQERLDRLLQIEFMHSVMWGHQDKVILKNPQALQRDWERPYPANMSLVNYTWEDEPV